MQKRLGQIVDKMDNLKLINCFALRAVENKTHPDHKNDEADGY